MRPDAKLVQLETTIMAKAGTDKYFDSPQERTLLREYLNSLSNGEMEVAEDGTLSLKSTAVMPWDDEKYKYKYSDLNGVDYTEGYGYTDAVTDPYMAVGYAQYEQFREMYTYEEYQAIYQQVEAASTGMDPANFQNALRTELNKQAIDLDFDTTTLPTDVTAAMFQPVGSLATSRNEPYNRRIARANEAAPVRASISTIPTSQMAEFLEKSNASPEDVTRKMVQSGAVFDLDELYTWDDADAKFSRVKDVGAPGSSNQSFLSAELLNQSVPGGKGYVSVGGNLMYATYKSGRWTFEPVLRDEDDNTYEIKF
jgi:hypothetical protein